MVEQRLIRAIQGIQPEVVFLVAYQNNPMASHVFCEVFAIGETFAGLPVYTCVDEVETVSTIYKYKVSLSYNGLITSKAHEHVRHMNNYLQSFQARLALKEQGISLLRIDDVATIPILKDTDMHMKYVLDILIASEEGDNFEIDVIDSVVINGDLEIRQDDYEIGG